MPVYLTNSVDIVANSVQIIKNDQVVDVLDNITNITGLPPETMNSLEKIASAMDNDPDFFSNRRQRFGGKVRHFNLQSSDDKY